MLEMTDVEIQLSPERPRFALNKTHCAENGGPPPPVTPSLQPPPAPPSSANHVSCNDLLHPPIGKHHTFGSSIFGSGSHFASHKNKPLRLFSRSGGTNTKFSNIPNKSLRFATDLFTTVVDLNWRYLFLCYVAMFVVLWSTFGTVYFLISFLSGDFEPDAVMEEKCLMNIDGLLGALLFSIETQTTIGYGYRTLSEHCPVAIFVLVIQAISSVFFESCLIGMTLAKMSRAKKRKNTIIISKNSCIGLYNDELCFMVRLGDLRNNGNLLEAHVRMYFITEQVSKEGELIPLDFRDMNVGYDTGEDRIVIASPMIVRHIINEKSPMYHLSKESLVKEHFEIVVILEGSIEQIGVTSQMRRSYLPQDITWGHYFQNCITKSKSSYVANFAMFEKLYQPAYVHPTCSAAELSLSRSASPLSSQIHEEARDTSFPLDESDDKSQHLERNNNHRMRRRSRQDSEPTSQPINCQNNHDDARL